MNDWQKKQIDNISNLNLSVYMIPSETSDGDKTSLLRLQNLIRPKHNGYFYLEVGSHLGGALVPHLLDPQCKRIYSIDKRPPKQPDERGRDFYYRGNSTERMLEVLRKELPAECLAKLITFDLDCSDVTREQIPDPVHLVFIDAEHTNTAVFSDFLNLFHFFGPSALIALHDANLIGDGIRNMEAFLRFQHLPFSTLILADNLAVIALGEEMRQRAEELSPFAWEEEDYFRSAKQRLWKEIAANTLYYQPPQP